MPPLNPEILVPFLNSIELSSTCNTDVLRIVWFPSTIKSPSIVTVDPSSEIILSVSCALPLSHFTKVLSEKF